MSIAHSKFHSCKDVVFPLVSGACLSAFIDFTKASTIMCALFSIETYTATYTYIHIYAIIYIYGILADITGIYSFIFVLLPKVFLLFYCTSAHLLLYFLSFHLCSSVPHFYSVNTLQKQKKNTTIIAMLNRA